MKSNLKPGVILKRLPSLNALPKIQRSGLASRDAWPRASASDSRQGRRSARGCQEFVSYYKTSSLPAEELTLIAEALVILEQVKDANEVFQDARDADSAFADAFIGQGELINEKYNYGEAASLFNDALKINPNSTRALLGLATSKQFESNEAQLVLIYKALEINANCVGALVARSSIDIESDNYEAATQQIDKVKNQSQCSGRDCACGPRCSTSAIEEPSSTPRSNEPWPSTLAPVRYSSRWLSLR